MMRVLCIGGPNDGETHSMEDQPDRATFRLPERDRMMHAFNPNDYAPPLRASEIRLTVYEIATLRGNGRDFRIAAPVGTPIDATMHALIQGYKN
jgi:hypothetical protein